MCEFALSDQTTSLELEACSICGIPSRKKTQPTKFHDGINESMLMSALSGSLSLHDVR